MSKFVEALFVSDAQTVRACMAVLDEYGEGIVLVVDEESHLIATVTDGDIRRAIINGLDIELPINALLDHRESARKKPLTAPVGTPKEELLELMNAETLRHIPLVDDHGRVSDIALLRNLVKARDLPMSAVVMAGGYGTRLRPLTEDLPKPMIPVDGQPIMERIVGQLRDAGVRRVNVTTHYKKEVISEHFGDGRSFGVEITYVEEKEPLGTAGALGLVEASEDPLLVINGDILTGIDFAAMLRFHQEHQADMTVAVKEYELEVPYGVVDTNGVRVVRVLEKPSIRRFVNAGIYLVNPDVLKSIPTSRVYDMPDLIAHLISGDKLVVSFPLHEYWLDVGTKADYEKAEQVIRNERI